MDQLINQVAQNAGISTGQAQKAIQTVVGFLRDKLPPQVTTQLEGLLGGQSAGGMPGQQQTFGNLGGMPGGNQPRQPQ